MKTGFFAGSFDPPTLGHLDLIQRAHALCDHLIIGVGVHSEKAALFSKEERVEMLKKITKHLDHVVVIHFEGLVVEAATKAQATSLFRGLRSPNEFKHEHEMATANRKSGRLETCFLLTRPELSKVSSSLVRELATHGKRLSGFVPNAIEELIFNIPTRQIE